jgi:hypothetical protein
MSVFFIPHVEFHFYETVYIHDTVEPEESWLTRGKSILC